jgi:hypothetical protein
VKVSLGPAGASSDGSDRFGAEGFAEVMVGQQHPASVQVLVEMVRVPAFVWAKPVALYSTLLVLRAEVCRGEMSILDDEAKSHGGVTQGLGVFFRNGLAVLDHGLYAKLGRFCNVLERFFIGQAPRMTVWQCGNLAGVVAWSLPGRPQWFRTCRMPA